MRKLFSHGIKYAFWGAAILILGSCIAPVNTEMFLENGDMEKIVSSGGGEAIIIGDGPSEQAPKFTMPGRTGEGTKISPYTATLSLSEANGKPKTALITITNANDVYGAASAVEADPAEAEAPGPVIAYSSIRWRCSADTLKTNMPPYADGVTFTVDTAEEPFNTPNSYQLSIQGKLDIWYSTEIIIIVVD